MEEVIGMLVKVSSYDDAGQQKLHDAILEVWAYFFNNFYVG